jgi:hypothetical protein
VPQREPDEPLRSVVNPLTIPALAGTLQAVAGITARQPP